MKIIIKNHVQIAHYYVCNGANLSTRGGGKWHRKNIKKILVWTHVHTHLKLDEKYNVLWVTRSPHQSTSIVVQSPGGKQRN